MVRGDEYMPEKNADIRALGLGKKIKTIREAKGLSIEEAAGRASLTAIVLSQIESGAVTPPVATLLKI